jgi:hypothetical protein
MEEVLSLLEPNERDRCKELAVFPEDAVVPVTTIAKLWEAGGEIDSSDTEALIRRLADLSLLLRFRLTEPRVRLHDEFREYLVGLQGDRLPRLHSMLLDACHPGKETRPGDPGNLEWADLPPSEPYLWDYLAYHLVEAGRCDELVETVKDLRYLAAKGLRKNNLAGRCHRGEME